MKLIAEVGSYGMKVAARCGCVKNLKCGFEEANIVTGQIDLISLEQLRLVGLLPWCPSLGTSYISPIPTLGSRWALRRRSVVADPRKQFMRREWLNHRWQRAAIIRGKEQQQVKSESHQSVEHDDAAHG